MPSNVKEEGMKKTYSQIWDSYNRAQQKEKGDVQTLAHDLCAGVVDLAQARGRPRLALADMLFCMIFKVYCGVSCRRVMFDMRVAHEHGFISRLPSFSTILRYFEKSELRQYLVQLIIQSSLPLRTVEKSFAMDSTGFSTSLFGRWFDFRYGKLQSRDKRKWIKAHLMCGVLTNIVTAVEVTDGNAGDAPYFEPLLNTTTQNFRPREVICDKAYSSLANFKHADSKGVLAVIPFKANANAVHGSGDPLWTRLYHFYSLNNEWFERRYHQRSNIESTNAMIKMKFGERIRSRTKVAQFNELLCKVLCHNICVTIQAYYELGIEPTFWDQGEDKAA
jgi:transposase